MADCKYGDPFCPCQDGDMCHYEGPDAWPVPDQIDKEAKSVTEMKRTGYMCAVDLEYHVGEDMKPTSIYASPEIAIEQRKCVQSCGLVEVEITVTRYVINPNYEGISA